TRGFVSALETWHHLHDSEHVFVGIDLGGTNTKYGLVTAQGKLLFHSTAPTPWKDGRDALLSHLQQTVSACLEEARTRSVIPKAIGLATAGWVDPGSGQVVYATENLPGWTGANPGACLR